MKERILINRVINDTMFETHCEATGHFPPSVTADVDDCRAHTCGGPHKTCVNGVNSHSCCCDPGFQEMEVDRVKLDFIHTTNARSVSHRSKVNEFASLTTSEFVSQHTGHKRNNVWSGLKHSRRALCSARVMSRMECGHPENVLVYCTSVVQWSTALEEVRNF